MSKSHEKLPKIFWAQLILAAIIGIIAIAMPSKHQNVEASESVVATATKNLAPVGAVATEAPKAAGSGEARSGEVVYKASCVACHATGVANAPKLDDKAAWEPRVATGLEAMLNTAINGKGAMPAKGGNPAITDEEIKNTVLYMASEAGFDLGGEAEATPEATPEVKKEEVKQEATKQEETKVTETAEPEKKEQPVAEKKTEEAKVEVAKAASAPVAPVSPEPPAKPKMEVAAKSMAIAAPVIAAAPKMEEKVAEAKADVKEVVENKIEPAKEAVAQAKSAVTTASPEAIAAGKAVYQRTCFACHATGVANSPKLDDKASWAPRIDAGTEALYEAALKGKGVMPPKGGNVGLSDEDVKLAVDYIVSEVQ